MPKYSLVAFAALSSLALACGIGAGVKRAGSISCRITADGKVVVEKDQYAVVTSSGSA